MNAEPAGQRHQKLKAGVGTRNAAHSFVRHAGVFQSVGNGDRERIHRKACAQKDAVDNKCGCYCHSEIFSLSLLRTF